ncbi:hypothetical protein KY334_08270 [Candidatus Woesearchaeota archaeon]|nr:hypothetical protein [Candidatus Woesearchaeota archaeon]
MNKKLEEVLEKKVEPVIDEAMKKYLGVRISEIKNDISDKILNSPLLGIEIDYSLEFKESKKKFKEKFIEKQLFFHHGNISEVAKVIDVDRRSIHRLVNKSTAKKIREYMFKPYFLKQQEVENIIEDVLDNYKSLIKDEKLEKLYKATHDISTEITNSIPNEDITLKDAEQIFEKKYLLHWLDKLGYDLSETSNKVGIRYETLIRKMKKLEIELKFDPSTIKYSDE